MKKQFRVEGMSCGHCRAHVEKALNSIEGISASVTLDPPVAVVESGEKEITPAELQEAVSRAGDYRLLEI